MDERDLSPSAAPPIPHGNGRGAGSATRPTVIGPESGKGKTGTTIHVGTTTGAQVGNATGMTAPIAESTIADATTIEIETTADATMIEIETTVEDTMIEIEIEIETTVEDTMIGIEIETTIEDTMIGIEIETTADATMIEIETTAIAMDTAEIGTRRDTTIDTEILTMAAAMGTETATLTEGRTD